MTAPFFAYQQPTATQLNLAVQKIVKRGRRVSDSTTTTGTTDIPVMRIDAITTVTGYLYGVSVSNLALDVATSADEVRARIRYTTDGTAAVVGSTLLPGASMTLRQADAAVPEQKPMFTTYTSVAGESLSLLLCVSKVAGASAGGILADGLENIMEVLVWNLGFDPGNNAVIL